MGITLTGILGKSSGIRGVEVPGPILANTFKVVRMWQPWESGEPPHSEGPRTVGHRQEITVGGSKIQETFKNFAGQAMSLL